MSKQKDAIDELRTEWNTDDHITQQVFESSGNYVYNEEVKTVKLVNKISARVELPGIITGTLYVWHRSGAIVEVDERDAPDLLEKKLGDKACCGSANKNYIFEIMKD